VGEHEILTFHGIANPNNERTSIHTIFPPDGFSNSLILILPSKPTDAHVLAALGNSIVQEYVVRNKMGSRNYNLFIIKQIPYLKTEQLSKTRRSFIDRRSTELSLTSKRVTDFAQIYDGPPFRWDDRRRFFIRCELDAAFFHLYLPVDVNGDWKPARIEEGAVADESEEQLAELKQHFPTPRDAVAYIMETFPIVKRKDEKAHGHYRTKDTILEIYDAMLEAQRTGQAYQTRLDPPPGPPTDAEGNFIPFEQWKDNIPSHIHQPLAKEIEGQELETQKVDIHWRDKAFEIIAEQRVSVTPERYRSLIVEALIKETGSSTDFEDVRRAYWLLTEKETFQRLGQEQLPELPPQWWNRREDILQKEKFLSHLRNAVGIGQIRLFRENGDRHIQWIGEDQGNPYPQIIDDARAALLLAELWVDEAAKSEWQAMEPNLEELFV
jgi:hypothetical protein